MPAVIGCEARKGRLRAYTADGHDGKVWLSDDFVYASEKVGEEARGRGAARRHVPVLVSVTAPGGDQYANVADPGQRALVRRHAAPHVAARRAEGRRRLGRAPDGVSCGVQRRLYQVFGVADRTVNGVYSFCLLRLGIRLSLSFVSSEPKSDSEVRSGSAQ